jgi:group I intron endonuclease
MGQIYKITNKINGKSYIGLTTREFKDRWREHVVFAKSSDLPLYRAIRKYGFEAFSSEILADSEDNEELQKLEIHFIEYFNTFGDNGYNLTRGGEGSRRLIISDKEIVEEYNNGLSAKKIFEKYGIARSSVKVALNRSGIETQRIKTNIQGYNSKREPITPLFESHWEAANWIIEQKLSSSKHESIRRGLRKSIHERKKSYLGIIWIEVGDSIEDTEIIMTHKLKGPRQVI